jgi:predicted transcriptional regulator
MYLDYKVLLKLRQVPVLDMIEGWLAMEKHMPKITITVGQGMDKALREIADERGAPIAIVIRQALESYLAAHGKPIPDDVKWGGNRKGEGKPA